MNKPKNNSDKPKINSEELRKQMRAHGDTNEDLARALDIHSSTVISRKISNWRDFRFSYTEMLVMIARYNLSKDDANKIFGELMSYYEKNYKYC